MANDEGKAGSIQSAVAQRAAYTDHAKTDQVFKVSAREPNRE